MAASPLNDLCNHRDMILQEIEFRVGSYYISAYHPFESHFEGHFHGPKKISEPITATLVMTRDPAKTTPRRSAALAFGTPELLRTDRDDQRP